MKVFVIGATGLLGSEGAFELIRRGHEVSGLALPPVPEGARMPPEMKLRFGDYLALSDGDLRRLFAGCDSLVFAAGIDERVEGPPPVYELFQAYNITPLARILAAAKECGVKSAVICGSYFCHFARTRPRLELGRWHPYIRSRIDQEALALSFADDNFAVFVLELPYIFGVQKGRKPVWVFLVEMIKNMRPATFFPKGGTAMITVKQAGQAIAGAVLRPDGNRAVYPIGFYNKTWTELFSVMHQYMGTPDKKTISIPKWMFSLAAAKTARDKKRAGVEGGLYLPKFADMQCSNQFIDRSLGCDLLGVEEDDIDAAIGESVRLSLDILAGKTRVVSMGEK